MLEPAGSLPPAQQQPALQQGTACNGSNAEQQCGDQGCGGGSDPLPAAAAVPPPGTVCIKCRKAEAEVIARGREPLCHPCLHEQLLSKVRNAVRVHSLILPGDQLALAYSGGPASAALLHFLAQLRNPRTDRPARGKVSFTLHVIHIDESAAHGLSPEQQAAATAGVAAAAAEYCEGSEGGVTYHCLPLESVLDESAAAAPADGSTAVASSASSGSSLFAPAPRPDQRQRLQSLLASVRDPTGRQDLARHLRSRLLLRAAAELDCARLARGDCATTLAAHIVAAASKGCGYSLAGDVRLVDARHGGRLPPVFLPLREVSARELGVVCARWHLPLADPSVLGQAAGPASAVDKKNINALAAAFVAGMEAHNPGSVPNILNTISKLEAFPWNDPPAPAGSQPGQQQQAHGGQVQEHCEEQEQEQQLSAVLCPICSAPLADDELPGGSGSRGADANGGHTSGGSGTAAAATAAGCCLSCFQQILGGVAGGDASGSNVAAALPGDVQQQMAGLAAAGPRAAAAASGPCSTEQLRQQIAEFLL